MFFGFLVAGEEIESEVLSFQSVTVTHKVQPDPFGYDKNDLVSGAYTYNDALLISVLEPGSFHKQHYP